VKRAVITLLALLGLAAAAPAGAAAAGNPLLASPYEYMGWDEPQPPGEVISDTGVHALTLAFILARHGCHPAWDGERPLVGGIDEAAIDQIRAAGGEVVASFGGATGHKLGIYCHSPEELAGAYEQVVTTYRLRAIDIDIEEGEIHSATASERVAQALAIVHQRLPHLAISITIGASEAGPEPPQQRMIRDVAAVGLRPYAWSIMPFDFGPPKTTMLAATESAAAGLVADLRAAYGIGARRAWRMSGISTMNGYSDEPTEELTPQQFAEMLQFAHAHELARMSFWSVNRDRSCVPTLEECSGIEQSPLQFTRLLAAYTR
jgi:hypothetical protein